MPKRPENEKSPGVGRAGGSDTASHDDDAHLVNESADKRQAKAKLLAELAAAREHLERRALENIAFAREAAALRHRAQFKLLVFEHHDCNTDIAPLVADVDAYKQTARWTAWGHRYGRTSVGSGGAL
jgi:hypothetical protein